MKLKFDSSSNHNHRENKIEPHNHHNYPFKYMIITRLFLGWNRPQKFLISLIAPPVIKKLFQNFVGQGHQLFVRLLVLVNSTGSFILSNKYLN